MGPMRNRLNQRSAWIVLLACWLAGVLIASELTWQAIGPHQPFSWARLLIACAAFLAAAGWIRDSRARNLNRSS